MATTAAPRSARLGRLERPALTGVLVREVVHYSSYWKSSTFSSTVEPTIYLLAFGFGFGSLVSRIGGYDYVDFVGTGTVATAVLFSSAFPPCSGRSSSTSSSARATRFSRRPATRPRRKAKPEGLAPRHVGVCQVRGSDPQTRRGVPGPRV
jgi:hypothetical protein